MVRCGPDGIPDRPAVTWELDITRSELYPIYHGRRQIFATSPLQVDGPAASVHFWDPMLRRLTNTGNRALHSAAMPCAFGMMTITAIMTTTRMRGAIG